MKEGGEIIMERERGGGGGRFLRVSTKSLSSHKWKKIDRQG